VSNFKDRLKTGSVPKSAKVGQEVVKGSRDPLMEFWDPLISLEQLKLETENLSHTLTTKSVILKYTNTQLGQRSHKPKKSRGLIIEYLDLLYLCMVEATNRKFRTEFDHKELYRKKYKIRF